jgi:hypothetical protein
MTAVCWDNDVLWEHTPMRLRITANLIYVLLPDCQAKTKPYEVYVQAPA